MKVLTVSGFSLVAGLALVGVFGSLDTDKPGMAIFWGIICLQALATVILLWRDMK